jgi:Spy/CpxP family protein refolding chaperone
MKRHLSILALLLVVVPAFAQDPEESLRELGMGALFADGNLFLRQLQRGEDPVQQLKRFFAQAKLPLSSAQLKQLNSIEAAVVKSLEAAGDNEEAIRRSNLEFTKRSSEVYTPEQRTELRRYRTEQIMMRGGFPALRFTLETAQVPLTPEQEKQVQAVYADFTRQMVQLQRDGNTTDRATWDKLEGTALGKVVRILNPAQRRALAESRQGSLVSKVRP